MKASELVYTIKNLKAGGKPSDDSQLSDFQILWICDYYRAMLIRQQISKNQSINEQCIQEIKESVLTFTQSTIHKNELLINQEIPKAIEGQRSNLFTFIGTQGGRSYQRTTYNKKIWDTESKYTACLPKWYELGNKLVLINHPKNLKISIKGLFENPIDVVELNGELDEMNPLSFEYPMSNIMIDSVIKMIAESELKLSLLLKQDTLNDGRDGEQ